MWRQFDGYKQKKGLCDELWVKQFHSSILQVTYESYISLCSETGETKGPQGPNFMSRARLEG